MYELFLFPGVSRYNGDLQQDLPLERARVTFEEFCSLMAEFTSSESERRIGKGGGTSSALVQWIDPSSFRWNWPWTWLQLALAVTSRCLLSAATTLLGPTPFLPSPRLSI